MTTPINISDEARIAAKNEIEHAASGKLFHDLGMYVQEILNSRDAELQSLRRDRARLDWLESCAGVVMFQGSEIQHEELRQAIDKAMQQ